MNQSKWHRVVVVIALAVTGVIVGANLSSNVAHGEVRGTPEPPAFQSGGQQSVPVLREIAATLRQIDSRLARLETVAQKLQTSDARSAISEQTEETK